MAEFYCTENASLMENGLLSQIDRTLVNDTRVLDNLLITEQFRIPDKEYFTTVQNEVKPSMRKIVASWMLEVCEDQRCENAVFPTAMNYFDRFLSLTVVPKRHLQLLGGVCLLMASKFRQTRAISIDHIVDYTDSSVTREEVLNWELLVLTKLKWNISATIPDDFLDHLMHRLRIEGKDWEKVRRHTTIFTSLSATDHHFMEFSPSVIACACLSNSAHGLSSQLAQPWTNLERLLHTLHKVTGKPLESIKACYDRVEALVRENMAPEVADPFQISYSPDRSSGLTPTNKNCPYEFPTVYSPLQPETPTDVQDVTF